MSDIETFSATATCHTILPFGNGPASINDQLSVDEPGSGISVCFYKRCVIRDVHVITAVNRASMYII